MSRKSKREVELVIEALTPAVESEAFIGRPEDLSPAEKEALAALFDDVDPWGEEDSAGQQFIERLHRREGSEE